MRAFISVLSAFHVVASLIEGIRSLVALVT